MPRLDGWPVAVAAADMNAAWGPMRAGALTVDAGDGAGGPPRWVWFLCPCGCGQEVLLPGHGAPADFRARRPWWRIDVQAGPDGPHGPAGPLVTLRPSVIVLTCGAHFFVNRNQVSWCGAVPLADCERLHAALYR